MAADLIAEDLVKASRKLSKQVDALTFAAPVHTVYNPLSYARAPAEAYLRSYGGGPKRVIFLGMNPGPFGMAQTGVPFGEIAAVRDFLAIEAKVKPFAAAHPKRPIQGFACQRSEVSGRRLWGAVAEHFGTAQSFFRDHFVANYCPLVFVQETGRNHTPDKLPAVERAALFEACDQHLRTIVELLRPEWVVGVGKFAEDRAAVALTAHDVQIGRVLHPSPASPLANKGWTAAAVRDLQNLGMCRRA